MALRILLAFAALAIVSCSINFDTQKPLPLFTDRAPQNEAFKNEIQFLHATQKLTQREKKHIEEELRKAEDSLGVPKALLWCVLFQESRFDPFKNALIELPAKGLGQFTQSALDEINYDTDQYDERTSSVLNGQLTPHTLPIDFQLKLFKSRRGPASYRSQFPPQPHTSYYRDTTAVFASAAYLNNRYQQLKLALDRQNIPYNPQVLWLYAAAAYNKGSRTVFLLLTHEYMARGEKALKELLKNPKSTYALLTRPESLDHTLKGIWTKKTRVKYIDELLRNMEVISSCALSEPSS